VTVESLEQVSFLLDLYLLGSDLLVLVAEGLPGRPPDAAELDPVRGFARQLADGDPECVCDRYGYGE